MTDFLVPISVLSVSLAYGMGVGPLQYTLLGEIMPLKVKGVATGIIIFIG